MILYSEKSEEELLLMGYGALGLWLILGRFGRRIPAGKLGSAADRASRELRKMFHGKPLKPWKARRGRGAAKIFSVGKRAAMDRARSYIF